MKQWLFATAVVVGLLALAAVIWFVGPLIAVAGVAPFEPEWVRLLVIGVICGTVGIIYLVRYIRRRRAAAALERELVEAEPVGDGPVLAERMAKALEALKASSGRKDYLYVLPWYIIVGPPGAGKTTALTRSGLKFPLAGPDGGAAIAGTSGTRYCDWWFTEEAVLIDTAGRYTTQDSDAKADRQSWLSFLQLLKRTRPKQPVNGVIIAISLEDLMVGDETALKAHSQAIRRRLAEIHDELKVDFPVYALFTKADLIVGFSEYFGNFTEARRRQVWGATFQTSDRKRNMVGEVGAEYDALIRRLTEELPDRLQEEQDATARIAIFGFPAQFELLRERVQGFLGDIFEASRYQTGAAILRGFYFSSGTQVGTPIDQILGAAGGAAATRHMSGLGRSYFLHDLITKVILGESGWVSTDLRAVRIAAAFRYGAMALIGLVSIGLLGVWGWSFYSNRSLISGTENFIASYRVTAEPNLTATVVSDFDLMAVLDDLTQLRNMPVGYSTRGEPVPLGETFGLSQRDRLVSAADTTYRDALERMLRSRLILRLENQLQAVMDDPIALYQTLKVYLMLGGKAPRTDIEFIVAWMRSDWENLYPGPTLRAARDQLEQHLRDMLALDVARAPSFELNGILVDGAQSTLARMNIADQAYALVQAAASGSRIPDFVVAERAGRDSEFVFETVDGTDFKDLRIPGLYTYAGFHDVFLAELSDVADELLNEQWVMGTYGEQGAVEEQFNQLGPQLLARYTRDFIDTWHRTLDNIKLRALSADKPQYVALSIASAPTSPIRNLVEAVVYETALTRDPAGEADAAAPIELGAEESRAAGQAVNLLADQAKARLGGLARIGIDLAINKSQTRAGQAPTSSAVPGADVEEEFRTYSLLLEGDTGRRPIDLMLQGFYEVYQNMVLSATNPSQQERANNALQIQVATLRAGASRLPRPIARMVNEAVEDFEGDAADTSIAQLNQMLGSTVTQACKAVTSNLYPFARNSERDVPVTDFGRLFAPNGIIDRFFAQNLAPLADMSVDPWVWKQDSRLGQQLSSATLREFQRAAAIRDAFFPQGGNMPMVSITIAPISLHGAAETALLEVNGQVVQALQGPNTPVTIQWPNVAAGGGVTLSMTPELPGRDSVAVFPGPWGLMRMVDRFPTTSSNGVITVRPVVGGRDVAYSLQVASIYNPFTMRSLSDFSCPAGL
ncbi:type VI secretion system membrane subunit TssM [Nostoc sp. 3335mG]|nr:type VI secretion system membrane subunit TssM [Nostoc sp. 3335mG]